MRQPADAAERGRGEERALRGVAVRGELGAALLQHPVDAGRERRVLHRDLAVALEERDHDVLALERGEQLVGRDAADGDPTQRALERRLLAEARRGLRRGRGERGGRVGRGERHARQRAAHRRARRGSTPPRPTRRAMRPARPECAVTAPARSAARASANTAPTSSRDDERPRAGRVDRPGRVAHDAEGADDGRPVVGRLKARSMVASNPRSSAATRVATTTTTPKTPATRAARAAPGDARAGSAPRRSTPPAGSAAPPACPPRARPPGAARRRASRRPRPWSIRDREPARGRRPIPALTAAPSRSRVSAPRRARVAGPPHRTDPRARTAAARRRRSGGSRRARARRAAVHGKRPALHEPRRARLADEERGDDELQLVDEILDEELRVQLPPPSTISRRTPRSAEVVERRRTSSPLAPSPTTRRDVAERAARCATRSPRGQ